MADRILKAHFIDPMLLLRAENLPAGGPWVYELKFDGFRARAVKTVGQFYLRSRNNKDFNSRYPTAVKALREMPGD